MYTYHSPSEFHASQSNGFSSVAFCRSNIVDQVNLVMASV